MNKPIKILACYWGRRGGGAIYALELSRMLATNKSVILHLSTSLQSDFAEEFSSIEAPSFNINTYSNPWTALRRTLKIPYYIYKLVRYIKDNKIDVVYCPMTHLWSPGILLAARMSGAALAVTVHDQIIHPGERFRAVRQALVDSELFSADLILTLTKHVTGELKDRLPNLKAPIVEVPHGPLCKGLAPRRVWRWTAPYPTRILFFGRIMEYKGLDILLAAYKNLKDDFPRLSLTIVGSGSIQPYVDAMHDAPDIEVENRYINEGEISKYVGNCDILVLPYKHASQSGVVGLAQGFGIPVVATPVGGLEEQLAGAALIAEDVSKHAVEMALRKAITDPDTYNRCAISMLNSGHKVWEDSANRLVGALVDLAAGP